MPPKTNRLTTLIAFRPEYSVRLGRFRRLRPRIAHTLPFNQDPAHTIPTKWSLYRSLLRSASSFLPPSGGESSTGLSSVRRKIRETWRRFTRITSPANVRTILDRQYTLLDKLRSPEHVKEMQELEAYYAAVYARRDVPKEPAPKPVVRMTGGFLLPSFHNPPMPQLRPQPPEISGMIRKRIKARANSIDTLRRYREWGQDMAAETKFWDNIKRIKGESSEGTGRTTFQSDRDPWVNGRANWPRELDEHLRPISVSMERYTARTNSIFTEEQMDKILSARKRRARHANAYNRMKNLEERAKQEEERQEANRKRRREARRRRKQRRMEEKRQHVSSEKEVRSPKIERLKDRARGDQEIGA